MSPIHKKIFIYYIKSSDSSLYTHNYFIFYPTWGNLHLFADPCSICGAVPVPVVITRVRCTGGWCSYVWRTCLWCTHVRCTCVWCTRVWSTQYCVPVYGVPVYGVPVYGVPVYGVARVYRRLEGRLMQFCDPKKNWTVMTSSQKNCDYVAGRVAEYANLKPHYPIRNVCMAQRWLYQEIIVYIRLSLECH